MPLCLLLGFCANTQIIDTACSAMPKGSIHLSDTLGTKKWMRTYEVNRQNKCVNRPN